ncbi:MAG TPA: hypothetical protein VKG84_08340 [Candidatus Acidoferrales bacterium]|nr:hypothetical protein [Candidatus Acidoferrales bacterium]
MGGSAVARLLFSRMMRYHFETEDMQIKPDPDTEKLIEKELEEGRFPDASSLVGVALKHFLIARELGEEYTREQIGAKVDRGLAELEAGEGLDGEAFFEGLRRREKAPHRPR